MYKFFDKLNLGDYTISSKFLSKLEEIEREKGDYSSPKCLVIFDSILVAITYDRYRSILWDEDFLDDKSQCNSFYDVPHSGYSENEVCRLLIKKSGFDPDLFKII